MRGTRLAEDLPRVAEIVDDVRRRGDAALLDWSERLDGARPPSLRVPETWPMNNVWVPNGTAETLSQKITEHASSRYRKPSPSSVQRPAAKRVSGGRPPLKATETA